ncbi:MULTISPECIES: 3,4-dihydroxyphenylacetate 2,3-dioxygenase [unclassified Bradyrhizobium]|uniref:3,4-dihydroxyphenylacetate 2,3-dioxygenase n=1 Tax=unclassified Bradyrhizobium TaxID=2631580 RepID=UPI001BA708B6|nr:MULTISPECIES: 3,4-dihydroxyphenylacetate 2,3-dioxygenase [unclassified Bradyrhizobium]MBR1201789.1 3,4-dihydroxyphenylacetate 2,3-dioxygenase [Bradyrhizobium sp. AUGA SZCCT0124]MBR1311642.1 3,4-dihydroxyphenylacetate 2,3-dioxygenase [Bradyrhizobium sp. AUGA SZCCT0051]MBR1338738.1 3,4-dihydroxyphenylacetate 2,3-dioxygenase [Bradyrhizobium sp. AUGA SZCCT0105]MBR1353312.1 3,4-dihydroxyphenylacetate 2,3-dioxygenase [Bradyrhizobium sp. AUGA SZCCT0045]
MGELVLAAKVSHVPSLMLSERPDHPLHDARAGAVAALHELGRRARERGVSTFVVFDTHWLSNFGYHVNANTRHRGSFTSHEAPQMIKDLRYDWPGNTALAEAIAREAAGDGLNVMAHRVESLGLEYGTIVPMHYLNQDGSAKVVSVASPLFTSIEESRLLGEATRRAVALSGERVALLASGSLSHRLLPNKQLGPEAWTSIASEFNRQVDLRVLELWQQRRYREFLDMLPDYATRCNGEGGMADTIMLFAALGWYDFRGAAEQLCDYFPSSGSGQVHVEFHLTA